MASLKYHMEHLLKSMQTSVIRLNVCSIIFNRINSANPLWLGNLYIYSIISD